MEEQTEEAEEEIEETEVEVEEKVAEVEWGLWPRRFMRRRTMWRWWRENEKDEAHEGKKEDEMWR